MHFPTWELQPHCIPTLPFIPPKDQRSLSRHRLIAWNNKGLLSLCQILEKEKAWCYPDPTQRVSHSHALGKIFLFIFLGRANHT